MAKGGSARLLQPVSEALMSGNLFSVSVMSFDFTTMKDDKLKRYMEPWLVALCV